MSQEGVAESVYVLPNDVSPDAITKSLQALLRTRHHAIASHRFTVLDTFDGRVRRAGARLTWGRVNGVPTVAWQPPGGRRLLAIGAARQARYAWELPEGSFQQTVAPVVGPRRLLAQADAEEHGSLLDLLDERGKTVARLRIASGRARLPESSDAWRPLPTLLTVTPLRGFEEEYARLVPVIESRPGIQSCAGTPMDVMLQQIGAPVRGDLSSPRVDLDPGIRADEGARRIHLALLGVLAANEPGLRADLDSEFLHDFRVAIRRTRSLLRQIRGVFAADVVQRFSAEFSWIGRLTGPPRDLDVLSLMLRGRRAELPPGDIAVLDAFLARSREAEHQALIQALDSDRYRRLMTAWSGFLQEPPLSLEAPNARVPLAAVIARRAWRLSRQIAERADTINERTAPETLHEVRILAKKLRYLIDAAPLRCDPADLEHVLAALKKLQRALGDFNDAHVQESKLLEYGRTLRAEGGAPAAAVALERIAGDSRQRREGLRREAIERLTRFRARNTRSACRRAFKVASKGWAQ